MIEFYANLFKAKGVKFFIRNTWLYTSVKNISEMNKQDVNDFISVWNDNLNSVRIVLNTHTNNFKIQNK